MNEMPKEVEEALELTRDVYGWDANVSKVRLAIRAALRAHERETIERCALLHEDVAVDNYHGEGEAAAMAAVIQYRDKIRALLPKETTEHAS